MNVSQRTGLSWPGLTWPGLSRLGLILFLVGLTVFIGSLPLSQYRLTDVVLQQSIKPEQVADLQVATAPMRGKLYPNAVGFAGDLKAAIAQLNAGYKQRHQEQNTINDSDTLTIIKAASTGFFPTHIGLFFGLSVMLALFGALLYMLPDRTKLPGEASPGIKNEGIFSNPATNGGWIGYIVAAGLIGLYILLYFYPEYLTNWLLLFDPLSQVLDGGGPTARSASQWFVYGTLYTLVILVMGVRMLLKYRGNPYQQLRTASVMFFQLCFAFLIPEFLSFLHQPAQDLKSFWPLDYSFYFDYRLDEKIKAGSFGLFMLVWGTALWMIGVPVLTYFFGKRWYCSWVCGCGGLAETFGDPYRQLSDKRLIAWKVERVVVHSVMVFAVLMTGLVLYSYVTEQAALFGVLDAYTVRSVYGFWIGSIFSGVVGTGFYPVMGNRVWCRFGCPLAAYLGLVQRFKSRFRITTNGGQCISCGNCSAYCEMGIDVRWYAQRGQDIVRSSCVGCGICSAVCPRGVLNLENADDSSRVLEPMPIIIGNDSVRAPVMTTRPRAGAGSNQRRAAVLLFILLPFSTRAQTIPTGSETRRYAIEVAGIRVGTMTATRQPQTDETVTYTLVSDVKVNFLVYKLKIFYKVVDVFRRGQLQRSTVETHTNRGDFSSKTEWKTDHYNIVAEQYKYSYRAVETKPITVAVTNLYFAEPAGQPTAFAEYFGDYFSLSSGKASGTYLARRDGREDEYQYERGQLVRIIKKNPLKNFIIRLLP